METNSPAVLPLDIIQLDSNAAVRSLPPGSIVRLYRLVDATGARFHVQIGYVETGKRDTEGTRSKGIAYSACDCPDGFASLALSIAGVLPVCCAHAETVIRSLRV